MFKIDVKNTSKSTLCHVYIITYKNYDTKKTFNTSVYAPYACITFFRAIIYYSSAVFSVW